MSTHEKTAQANELLAQLVELSREGYRPNNDELVKYMHMCDTYLAKVGYGARYYKHMAYARLPLLEDLHSAIENLLEEAVKTEFNNSKESLIGLRPQKQDYPDW